MSCKKSVCHTGVLYWACCTHLVSLDISKLLTKGFHLYYEFASVNYKVIRGLVSGASVFFSPSTRWAEGQGPSVKKY